MRTRRSPHGERGLKLLDNRSVYGLNRSLSSRRAWIEILTRMRRSRLGCRSPHGERGLKSFATGLDKTVDKSLSSRRAWIEISGKSEVDALRIVALLTESVD